MGWMRKRARQAYQLLDRVRLFLVAVWEGALLPLAAAPMVVGAVVVLGMWLAPDPVPADRCPEVLPDTPPASPVPVPDPDATTSGIPSDVVGLSAGYGQVQP